MNVVSVLGSPRKRGNTATVLGWVEEELRRLGHVVDRVNIVEQRVGGCLGCGGCQATPDHPGCTQQDDALDIFERFRAADAILFATPLYNWGFSSQLKRLLDRCYCLVTGYGGPAYRSLVAGRRSGLVVTCAGPVEGNADLIVTAFKRISAYARMRRAGHLVVPLCTSPDRLGDAQREQAKAFAAQLAG